MNSEPPATSYYSLDIERGFWSRWGDPIQALVAVAAFARGVDLLRADATSWMGWSGLGLGVVGLPLFTYSWWRRHRQERHFRLHDTGVAFLTGEMRKAIHIPLENLDKVRWAAGNLHLETKDGHHHRLMTSFLPYDRIQEIKADIREWGDRVGIEILG